MELACGKEPFVAIQMSFNAWSKMIRKAIIISQLTQQTLFENIPAGKEIACYVGFILFMIESMTISTLAWAQRFRQKKAHIEMIKYVMALIGKYVTKVK